MELVVALFGLGGGEILLVALLILVLFGAERIPELMRSLGRAQARFAGARDRIVETIEQERAGLSREQVEFERARERQVRPPPESPDPEDEPSRPR